MPRMLLPNFTFEDQVTGRTARDTQETQRAADELAPLMALLAEPGDTVIVRAGAIPGDVPECLNHAVFAPFSGDFATSELLPWGWSSAAAASAKTVGMKEDCWPSMDAVRHVNGRCFFAEFDVVVDASSEQRPSPQSLTPSGTHRDAKFGTLCRNVGEWRDAVSALSADGFNRWVAKPEISHAGRNRLIASGHDLNGQQRGWLEKHVRLGGCVYVEPWVKITAECGLQFEIDAGGEVRFLGATPLLNDPVGRYHGSIIHKHELVSTWWLPAVDHGRKICRAAFQAGYFGPLGIDSMTYEDAHGQTHLRPVNDVNARFTMGRLALELRSQMRAGECGVWWHSTGNASTQSSVSPEFSLSLSAADGVRSVRTNPKTIGHRPVRATSLLYVCRGERELASLLELIRPTPSN